MTTVKELIKRLERYDKDMAICAHLFIPKDVKTYAETDMDVTLTDEEASDAIFYIENHIDSTIGITWETVECAIDEILEGREENNDGNKSN